LPERVWNRARAGSPPTGQVPTLGILRTRASSSPAGPIELPRPSTYRARRPAGRAWFAVIGRGPRSRARAHRNSARARHDHRRQEGLDNSGVYFAASLEQPGIQVPLATSGQRRTPAANHRLTARIHGRAHFFPHPAGLNPSRFFFQDRVRFHASFQTSRPLGGPAAGATCQRRIHARQPRRNDRASLWDRNPRVKVSWQTAGGGAHRRR